MELLSVLSSLFLAEAEERILVISRISHRHVSESGCKTLQDLLLSLFGKEKLHMTADGVVGTLVDTNQVAPFI
jgi:hypothetical protein